MESKAILDAFKLCANSFTRCFEQIGAKQFTVIGEPFDPRLHEPVQEIKTNEYPDSTVIHELRRGFMFKDRVLRPALVNVTAALTEEEAAEQAAAAAAKAAAAPQPAAEAPQAAGGATPAPEWVEDVARAEAAAAPAVEAAPAAQPAVEEAAAAPEAPTAGEALQKLVKTDDSAQKRSGTETVDINLPPIGELPAMELTATEAASDSGDAEDTVQVYEISEEDANAPAEELAEAQPAKVSDD